MPDNLADLRREITACRHCPRLVEWRERTAREKRAAYRNETYWGRPVPGFGDPAARVLLLGLAPGAHGANRTGRPFTGDGTGFLFDALYRAGLADRRESRRAGDGLQLYGLWISNAVRCAPPQNRPTPSERDACLPYLGREIALLRNLRVAVCLGAFAWGAALRTFGVRPKPKFEHGAEHPVPGRGITLLGCYHTSRQNTFTGRLTPEMLDAVLMRARNLGGS
ncbi:uracil-DNA glycosylase [Rubrobacter taiwanensis]|uniref:Type-5 uracil-DNA glycosylase n=1 Tax=Rubrobacter taiwanensis TaxID=185139 RepID=A0A4R1BS28_9ACTN|nr:uracil-DNA glycosylase [Rubrobacter taiwanensis]